MSLQCVIADLLTIIYHRVFFAPSYIIQTDIFKTVFSNGMYQLPTLNELKTKQPTKESWKSTVKEAVNQYWSETLKNEAYEKSTLSHLDIDSMKIGETHPVWNSLDSVISDVRKGTIKCRMLTGTYILQSTSHKFSRATVSATCKCCGLYDEDLAHMLLECPAFIHQRKPLYSEIKTQVINCIGAQKWRELCKKQ